MRICVVSGGTLPVPPVRGGAVETLLGQYLGSVQAADHEVVVYSKKSPEAQQALSTLPRISFRFIDTENCGVRIWRWILGVTNLLLPVRLGNPFIREVVSDLRRRAEVFDVVVVENRVDYVRHLARVVRAPMVLHLHNDLLNRESGDRWGALGHLAGVIAVSDFVADRVRSMGTTVPVTTVRNGVDLGSFQPVSEEGRKVLRRKYSLADEGLVVLYAGRLVKSKGVGELVEAFGRLSLRNAPTLIVAGSARFGSKRRSRFEAGVRRRASQLEHGVVFTGYQPHDRLRELYSVADLVVVPSIATEASPLVVVEAMASGRPVIGSDSGGIPELLRNGGGLVVQRNADFVANLADAMAGVLEDDEGRAEMGEVARARALSRSCQQFAADLDRALVDFASRLHPTVAEGVNSSQGNG